MTLHQEITARAAERGRTFDQQAAFERLMGDAQTVRDQAAMRAEMADAEAIVAEDVYTVTTTAGARLGYPAHAIRDTRAEAIAVATRLHEVRVSNGATGADAVRVEHKGLVVWAIRDNGDIIS